MATIPQLTAAMQTVLTSVAEKAARATGFVQRQSKLTGALFVQTLVFGFLADRHASRESLAQTALALGLDISPQGLDQRMTFSAAACLEQVLEAAATTVLVGQHLAIPLLARFNGVYLLDTTRIGLPRTLAHIWRGTTNQHTKDRPHFGRQAGAAAGCRRGRDARTHARSRLHLRSDDCAPGRTDSRSGAAHGRPGLL